MTLILSGLTMFPFLTWALYRVGQILPYPVLGRTRRWGPGAKEKAPAGGALPVIGWPKLAGAFEGQLDSSACFFSYGVQLHPVEHLTDHEEDK